MPPPDRELSTEATRPGTEVDEALARVGKHIEEYFHAGRHHPDTEVRLLVDP